MPSSLASVLLNTGCMLLSGLWFRLYQRRGRGVLSAANFTFLSIGERALNHRVEGCQAPRKIYRLSVKLTAFFFAKRCDEKLIKSNGKYMSAIASSINVSANKCSASMIHRERGG